MRADRSQERHALFSLAVTSRPEAADIIKRLAKELPRATVLPLEVSLAVLASPRRDIPARVAYEGAIRVAVRRGAEIFEPDKVSDALDRFLAAVGGPDAAGVVGRRTEFFADAASRQGHIAAQEAAHGGPPPRRPTATKATKAAATKAASEAVTKRAAGGPPAKMQNTVNKGGATWTLPTCGCVTTPADETLTLEFYSSRTVQQLAPYADPRNWPNCSAFFVAMGAQSIACSTTTPATDWVGTFLEEVEFVYGYPMITPLRFDYHVIGTTEVRSTYRLIEPTDHVLVDGGGIDIVHDPNGPAGMMTKITAVKTIDWKASSLNLYPGILCDTSFGEFGLDMACDCGNGP